MEAQLVGTLHNGCGKTSAPYGGKWSAQAIGWFAALVGWTALVAFYNLDGGARFEPTDAWVAQTAREMLEQADWLVPRFSGEVRLQKSPGPYWVVMAVSLLRGTPVDEVSTRIPNAMGAVVIVAVVFWLTRRIAGERAAIFGGFAAASSALILYWSHRGASDLGLTALLTVSLATLWAGSGDEPPGWRRNLLWMTGYFSAGCAMLYKLPMPLVCVGVPALTYLFLQRKWRILWSPWHLLGLALFCLPWLPWVVMICLTEPTATPKWRVEFWDRFTGELPNVENQKRWYFYFMYLIPIAMFTLPYTLSLPSAFVRAIRERHRLHADGIRFVLIWFLSMLAFFTIATGKETRYFLPALPPLFVLLGVELAALFDPERLVLAGRIRIMQIAVWFLIPVAIVAGGVALREWAGRNGQFTWDEVRRPYLAVVIVFGAGACAAAGLYRSRRTLAFATLVVTMWATWSIGWSWLFPIVQSQAPFRDFAEQLQKNLDPSLRSSLAQVAAQDSRIIWYSDVRFPRVVDQLELLAQQGGKRSLDVERQVVGETMIQRLSGDGLALFVAARKDYITFLVESRAALTAAGRPIPAIHLWMQSRIGPKKLQTVLFGNKPPPWPEQALNPPSDRLDEGSGTKAGVEPAPVGL